MKVFGGTSFNFTLVLSAVIASLGGLLFGYNTAIISAVLVYLPKEWELGFIYQGVVVSSLLLGAVLGAAFSGKIADNLGRRDVILGTAAVYALGTFNTAVASTPVMLVVGRIICGIAIGSSSLTVPLYISEIAPAKHRGMLVSFNQLAITLGILMAFTIGADITGRDYGWRIMLLMGVIPAIFLGVGGLFLPESPRWLVFQEDEAKARTLLARMGSSDVEADIRHIQESRSQSGNLVFSDLFRQPLRRPLLIGVGIFLVQQLTGINTVLYYAPTVFKMAGYTTESAGLAVAVSIGLVNVLATLVSMALVDRVGRRRLLLTGLAGMIVCLMALGLSVAPIDDAGHLRTILAMGSLFLFVAFFAVGIGVMGWLITSELYPQSIRGSAMSLPTMAHWASNLVVSLLFLSILENIGPSLTFWVFAVVGILGFLFCSAFVPETKGLSLEDIERHWLQKKRAESGEDNIFRLWVIAGLASLGGLITGYEWGVMGGVMLEIRKTWVLSPSQEGLIVSAFVLGATIAVIFSGKLADSFGRRTIVLALAVFFVTGSYVCGLAPLPEWLAVGRVLLGMSAGVASFAIPLYLSEIAPASIRGAVVIMNQLATVAGGLLAAGLTIIFDYYDQSWRDLFTLVGVPSTILAVTMLFLPESPSWLLTKNDPGGTRRMLRKLGVRSPTETLEAMKEALAASSAASWLDLFKPWLRRPLIIGMVIFMLPEIAGHSVLLGYGPTILQDAGFASSRSAMLANIGLGLLDLSMVLLSMRLVDRLGRRPLLLTGLMGIVVSLGTLGLGFFLKQSGLAHPMLKWLSMGSLMVYTSAFGISLGAVCNLIVTELFPLSVRGVGMSIAACSCSLVAVLMSFAYPRLVALVGNGGTFWLYGLASALGWVFCYALAPETKGKTLQEIEWLWLKRRSGQEPI